MIYDKLILNRRNWERLALACQRNHLHHALLFYGPDGTGKVGHAVELAAFINCEQPGGNGACGSCPSCKKVRSFQHSNVKLVIPYPRKSGLSKRAPSIKALTDADLKSLRQQMDLLGKDPYHRIELANANTILINSIRELRTDIYMSTPDRGSRIILIFHAEMLCIPSPESANALLKILEEPPEKTYFILVTSHPDKLLETILSRCQKIYFPQLRVESVEELLIKSGVSHDDARLLARLSEGSIHLAKNFQDSVIRLYEDGRILLNAVFSLNPAMWLNLQQKVRNLKLKSKHELEYFFRIGIFSFRDMLMLKETGDPAKVIFTENRDNYLKILDKYPQADWSECIAILEDAAEFIFTNGHIPLVLNAMLMEMRSVIRGKKLQRFTLHE